MRRVLGCLALLGVACATTTADANVTLKNLNFTQGYTDVLFAGGLEMKLERVYNSKTGFNGIFGWGWGVEFSVYYDISCDGTVLLHEYGGGADNEFKLPGHPTAAEVDSCVDKIIVGAKVPTGEITARRASLTDSAGYRSDEWKKLVDKNAVERLSVSPGVYHSTRFGNQTLVQVKGGLERILERRKETFDEKGRLVKTEDSNQNWITYGYDAAGIKTMSDNLGNVVTFELTSNGKVKGFKTSGGKSAIFTYDKHGDLVESRDVDGNLYRYTYSPRHNMTSIAYADKTRLEIGYNTFERHENVRFVKDRDGTVTTYTSREKTADSDYSVATEVADHNGAIRSSNLYEYTYFGGGDDRTRKLVETFDGDRTATTYEPHCTLPIEIVRVGGKTTFTYDDRCHVTLKDTPTETTRLVYSPTVNKVTRVDVESKTDAKNKTWSQFSYDDKANLLTADDSEKHRLKLTYDAKGQIATMTDLELDQTISFKYNTSSKPTEITVGGLGALTINYEPDGTTIKKVESSGGRNVSLALTNAFQNLNDVIRPAGVTLSF